MKKIKQKKFKVAIICMLLLVATVIVGFLAYRQIRIVQTETEYKKFLVAYENQVVSLSQEASEATYDAYTTGRSEDYAKSTDLNIKLNDIYLDKNTFDKIKYFKESGYIQNPLYQRELEIQYVKFMASLSDKAKLDKITELQSNAEKKFNTYRVLYQGRSITDNEVETILKTSKRSAELKTVWEGSKKIGNLMGEDVLQLVKLRNEYARDLGFSNYQQMSLTLEEYDPKEVEKIFDDLDVATRDIYRDAKAEIDVALAKQYGIKVSELQPWHYQNRYFQEVPGIFNVNLDSLYADKNILALAENYYQKLGLPIDSLANNSDLYAKPGKYQHAVAFDIDRGQDVRVIANIQNDNYWMHTLLHEFGHALYFQKIDSALPWELRLPAHTFTTEAVALLFQDMVYSPEWMREDLKMSDADVATVSANALEYNRLNALIFSRWSQVMYRFEKGMYENPDQDLNQLWWDLVEKYQLIQKPTGRNSADWASKIHIIQTPIYYHNYMFGYLYAAQLRHYINTRVIKTTEKVPSYSGIKEVGEYLVKNVFASGARYSWSDFVKKSTGETLNPAYFASEVKNFGP